MSATENSGATSSGDTPMEGGAARRATDAGTAGSPMEGAEATPGRGSLEHDPGARRPVLASIWAQDRTRVLGTGSAMLWHVPADFAHFRSATLGCPVIMGRASWEALGGALPKRPNIVITSDPDFDAPGARVVTSLEAAVDLGCSLADTLAAPTVWITGGGQV